MNDTLGHNVGDALLQQVAGRLNNCVRSNDTVARFGGDEFAVILTDLSADTDKAVDQASRIGHKIMSGLKRPYRLGADERHITGSMGITLFGGTHDTVDDVMKRADLAMYQGKDDGRDSLQVFDPAMRAAADSRVAPETQLRGAPERGEIVLYYQPQVNAEGDVTGAEALARWTSPERGVVLPAEFIPVAEETALILPLGDAPSSNSPVSSSRRGRRGRTRLTSVWRST